MEDLILIILELVLEVVANLPFNSRAHVQGTNDLGWFNVVWQCLLFAVLGGAVGGLSLLLMPHGFLQHWGLQLTNIIATPLLAAFLAYHFASKRLAQNVDSKFWLNAWRAYSFTLALVLVRYTFLKAR